MQIPKKIKIGAVTYAVVFPHSFTASMNACGQICYADDTIRLDPLNASGVPYSPTRVWQNFIHEVVHGINDSARAGLGEDDVDRFASLALAVLIDNGWLEPELPPT